MHIQRLKITLPAVLLCLPCVSFAQDSEQQEADQQPIEEIIVTVERREQNLQDLGVTAYSFQGEELALLGAQDLTDLSELAPGLEIGNKGGNVEVWIRGVGSSNNTELGDPAAATHLDGVYIPRTSGIGSVFFDIARVEVNVGPQGTLRGRNATAGSVNIISWRPGIGIFDAAVEAEYGDYEQQVYRGMLNIPLGDSTAVRLAGYSMQHDSYYNDVGPLGLEQAEAADNQGYRAQLLFEPSDRLRILLAGDLVQEGGTGWTGTNYANPLGNGVHPSEIDDPRDVYARAFTPRLDTEHWGLRLEIAYDFDFATLEYMRSRRDLLYNYDAATPLSPDWPGVANVLQPVDETYDDWSRFEFVTDSVSDIHELRLIGDGSRTSWTTGIFWFEEDQYTFLGSVGDRGLFFQGSEFNQPDTDSSSASIYGDLTWDWNERTRLTVGLRYSDEEKSRVGVNARYAFALGGRNFTCCGGVRIGTEGFEFAERGRTIFEPDGNGDGTVSDDEYMAFYYDGIKQFGARDNVEAIFAKGTYPGGVAQDRKVACVDTLNQDDFYCPPDGLYSFVQIINPDSSITPQFGEMSNSFLDWRARIEYDVNPDTLAYGMVSTGHKSGGFNDTFTGETGLPVAPTYDEEQVVVYEFGFKSEFDLGSVPTRFNASGFYYDYSGQVFTSLLSVEQALDFSSGGVELIDVTDTGAGSLVVSFSYNAADSEIYGLQFEGGFLFPYGFNFDWTALWLEAQIESALPIQDFRFQADVAPKEAVFRSIDGRRLPHTPQFQLNGSLSQAFPVPTGTLSWVLSFGWRDDQHRTIFNSVDFMQPDNPRLRLNDLVEGFWTFDAGIAYAHEGGKLRIEGFVSNLTDEVHEAAQIITQFDNTRFFTRPRAAGIRVGYWFGG